MTRCSGASAPSPAAVAVLVAGFAVACSADETNGSATTSSGGNPAAAMNDASGVGGRGAAAAEGGVADANGSESGTPQCDDSSDGTERCVTCTRQGWISGGSEGNTCHYLGIPYAKPPVGELRWAAPEPVEAWSGVRDATAFGAACVQRIDLSTSDTKSEDCLFVNVWTPEARPGALLPVMVFIHGGGYSGGATNAHIGQGLSEAGPVVVVSMNYRLGPLGFFAHPQLEAERSNQPPGSDGIRDQQLALRWVQDNIVAFGGDTMNVTLFGESAGSSSVGVHQVSPGSAGLVQRFIMESGVSTRGVANGIEPISRDEMHAMTTEMAAELCPDATDIIACLRQVPPERIMQWTPSERSEGTGFVPVIEGPGGVLPEHPDALLASGKHNQGAVLVGTNLNEYGLFQLTRGRISTIGEFRVDVEQRFGDRADDVWALYAPASDEDANQAQVTLMTDIMFRCATRRFARAATEQGSPVYLYSFEQGAAIHADELGYVFGPSFYKLNLVVPEQSLMTAIQNYWISFARDGDPNAAGLADWPRYSAASDEHMVLAEPLSTATGLQRMACDFWDGYLASQ